MAKPIKKIVSNFGQQILKIALLSPQIQVKPLEHLLHLNLMV